VHKAFPRNRPEPAKPYEIIHLGGEAAAQASGERG
jgi:hypothetical protein